MDILRTPEDRFINLPDYNFDPHYIEINSQESPLRVHSVDEGPQEAPPTLLLHGEPSWCFLYRKMIPILTAAGNRAIAPDLVGFGRSDKLTRREDYSYQLHVDVITEFIKSLDL